MFNPERLLGGIVKEALGGGLRRSYRVSNSRRPSYRRDLSTQLGVTLLGAAIAAAEHFFSKQSSGESQPQPQATSSTDAHPPVPPPPPPTPIASVDPLLLVKTMVAAAAADGRIDDEERTRLLRSSATSELSVEESAYLESLLKSPPSLGAIISEVSSRAVASQVYLAALLAIEIDNVAEEQFLRSLAEGSGLSAEETKTLRAQVMGNN